MPEAPAAASATCSAVFSAAAAGGPAPARQQARPRRGADVETETSLPFSDAIDGSTVSLRLTGEGPCKVCKGTGAKAGTVPRVCPTCEGTGQGSRNLGASRSPSRARPAAAAAWWSTTRARTCSGSGRAMSTPDDPGADPGWASRDGQRIKLPGKGAPGERGGPPGDLYVRVHVEPHPHGIRPVGLAT